MDADQRLAGAAEIQDECTSFIDQLFRRSNLIIALRDTNGRFLRVGRRLERMFAAVGVDPIGLTVFDVLPHDLATQVAQHDRESIETGRHSQTEEEFVVGGVRRAYLTSRVPLYDSTGRIESLVSIATDITARKRNEEALQNAALAVSGARREEIFDHLVRYLARTLEVEFAFIAALPPNRPGCALIIAGHLRGRFIHDIDYRLEGTPCDNVMGKAFEFIPRDLGSRFPADTMMRDLGFESYAAYPMFDADGQALGLIGVAHGEPLANRQVTESILRIFSARAAAELERQRVERELRISEANYREIFENAEDAIFVHDFDTGAILDVNPKACRAYGYTEEELRALDVGKLSSGVHPYTMERAARLIERAKRGEKVRTEWHRRNRDGSLHWDEVVIHRAMIAGQRRILVFTREISERKAAEEALRASEEQYRAIFNVSVNGCTLWDADGRLVDVNPAFCRIYGYTREEVLTIDPRELVHENHRHEYDDFLDTVRRAESFRMEALNRRRDGASIVVEVRGVPMIYRGRPHLLVFVQDITERREREFALRASEEQYRAIFNASADGMILFDETGRIVDVNPAIESIYGYGRAEFLSLDPFERFHPSAHPVLARFLERLRSGWYFEPERGGRPLVEETREITRDGRVIELEAHIVGMRYQGRPHVLTIKRDVTERKHREQALKKSEDRLRATVEAALDCIVSMDGDGRVIEFNAAAEACFGYSRERAIGARLADLIIPAAHREAHQRGMERYRHTGHGTFLGRRVEVNALRADGSEFPAELAIAAAQGPEGDIFVGYLRDISEQRRMEAERRRLEQQLRQAQKMEAIGHLTGGIAHDFNNILTSILGYTMMAQERADEAGDPALGKYLGQIAASGERARDLIRQMLTFSRGQRGEPRLLALPRLVEECIKLFGSTFPSSTTFSFTVDDAVPPVMLDPIQLEQVLMNLCINSRDAMAGVGEISIAIGIREVGGRHVCGSCRQSVVGRFVELAVTDTGPGIAPDVMESMFEPFYTTKDVGQGSGMGLSTTHGIVHEYGGHILVKNKPGKGARISVLFPAASGTAAGRTEASGREAGRQESLVGKVMVVDDEPPVREFLREFLTTRGLDVTVARDGAEALHALSDGRRRCDLLITDQTMPRVNGVELAYRLKAVRPGLPVILISGFSDAVTGRNPEELGVEAVLAKPVDHRELIDTMRRLLPETSTGGSASR